MKEKFRHSLKRTIAFVSALTIITSATVYAVFAENEEKNDSQSGVEITKHVDDYTSLFPGITSPKLKLSDPVFTEKDWYEYIEYEFYTEVKDGDMIYRIYKPTDFSEASIMAITDYNPKEVLGGTSNITMNLGELQGILDIAAQGGSISKEFVGLDLANGIASNMNSINDVMDNIKYYSSSSFLGIPGDKKYTGVTNDGFFSATSLEIEITESETVSACKTVAMNSDYSISESSLNEKTRSVYNEVSDANSNTHEEGITSEESGTIGLAISSATSVSTEISSSISNSIGWEIIHETGSSETKSHKDISSNEWGVEAAAKGGVKIPLVADGEVSIGGHYNHGWADEDETSSTVSNSTSIGASGSVTSEIGSSVSTGFEESVSSNVEKTNSKGTSSSDSSTIEHGLTSGNEDGISYQHANEMSVDLGYGVDYQYGNEHSLSVGVTVVDVPTGDAQIPYTTWVDFTANVYFDGVKYGTHTFQREIKGKIDMPDPSALQDVIKSIPKEIPEHYRLPGYVTLESERLNYGVNIVQNIDIQWSVVKNADGSTADSRVLDPVKNELIYLKDETDVTLQYDFVFDGKVICSDRITRTIPAKSIEGQVEYANNYIKSFVPSIISGETYFPTTVPLYDLTVSWIPDIESGKVDIGANETVNGTTYKVINVGEKAGYMEWAKVYANIERNGDDSFKRTGLEFDVQLAGNSSEITMDKIPDINLYNALLNVFDKKYGNKDNILTEEEIYDTSVLEKLGYELDLSGKGIKCLSGIKYLKYLKKINLSNNDLSGTNASLGELASLNYLEQLSLSNCGISEIPSSVFSSKFLIEGIDLSYNKLKDVNFLTLTDSRTQAEMQFTELKELFLQGNYISDISNLSFVDDSGELVSRIPNVTVLTLSRDLNYYEYKTGSKTGKKIFKEIEEYDYDITTSMDIAPLGLLKNVTTLWLSNNFITDISPLANCKLLATLDLSGNKITASTSEDGLEPLSRLQSLVCLKLDNNNISTVKSLRRLIYLEVLSLSNNHIGNTSGILDGLTYLTYLDLDNNELSSFDAGSFRNLQRLCLENQGYYDQKSGFVNTLEQVQNLDQVTGLVELRLNNNNIDSASVQSISNLENLEYLSLSGNTVVDLSFLQDLIYLTHLELARCKIRQSKEISGKDQSTGEQITETVDNLTYLRRLEKLVVLDLSDNNEIGNISALSSLKKLGVFYINNVELESADAVKSMTKLQYLSMQNSGIKDGSSLNTLNQLEYLNLAGHKFDAFDFRNFRSYDNITGLFLDSAENTEAINVNSFKNKQNLKYMSLSNMNIGSVDVLPDMDNITYLGLRNTNISDFNGTYSETDGYIYPITRFNTLKYLDVADNPELFTKKNLEMLYDFVGKPEQPISIILYRDNAPEGYVPGTMNPDVEAKIIKNDIDFGEGGTDILAALEAGYTLQNSLNGYDVEWNIEDNDSYYVEDGKLYFKETEKTDKDIKITLNVDIKELYYRENNPKTNKVTPVSFKASIKTTTKPVPTGEKKFVKTEETTSSENKLDGWILDEKFTEFSYSEYGDWSEWNKKAVAESELRQVETKPDTEYSDWSDWSDWTKTAIEKNELTDVKTKQEPREEKVPRYFTACSSGETSIRDALIHIGVNYNSDTTLKEIAVINGMTNYSYGNNYNDNITMLKLLKEGKLIEKYESVTEYDTMYSSRTRSIIDITLYRYRDRSLVPSVYHFHRDIYEDICEDVIDGMTLVVEK